MYRGSRSAKIIEANWNAIAGYGLGVDLKKTDIERIFHYLVAKNILKEVVTSNKGGFPSAYLKVLY